MEAQLSQVNQELALAPSDSALYQKKVRSDHLLADYYEDICEAARIKAGLRYQSQGERPTKYFTELVKKRAEKSSITSLTVKDDDGSDIVVSTIEEILEEASNFYSSLYSKKVPASRQSLMNDYIQKNSAKTLSDIERAECDTPISVEELQRASRKLPGGKAPGIDGLPAEFFLIFFWMTLRRIFWTFYLRV
jgi:hypothetical protein